LEAQLRGQVRYYHKVIERHNRFGAFEKVTVPAAVVKSPLDSIPRGAPENDAGIQLTLTIFLPRAPFMTMIQTFARCSKR
jgi:hypothetical protein